MIETKFNIKPGDIVRLKPIKATDVDAAGDIQFNTGTGYGAWVSSDLIESVEPRPLQPGDLVMRSGWGGTWDIIAINDHLAWVISSGGTSAIVRLSGLTRVDQ